MNLPSAKQQPPTSAKVVLVTSHGELEIQIWSREAPLAARNFIQHCLHDYYNGCIFHRIIPSFMIQGGDPTGTGTGGQSIYGHHFKDQFHQRLRFNRRGIVAMANAGPNTNGSQFFLTFGDCEHLNKKHTIFGKVVGDTIYNLMSLQSLDTDQGDRPLDAPVIRRAKVILNPFDNIPIKKMATKQQQTKKQITKQDIAKQQQKKKIQIKRLKNKNKLTFDCEQVQQNSFKVKSSHDMLNDSKLSNKVAIDSQDLAKKLREKEEEQRKKRDAKDRILNAEYDEEKKITLDQQLMKKRKLNQNIGSTLQDQILNYTTAFNPQTQRQQIIWQKEEAAKNDGLDRQQKMKEIRALQRQQFEGIMADELNFKRVKEGSHKNQKKMLINQQIELLSNAQRIRYEFVKKNAQEKVETSISDKLSSFTSKLKSKQPSSNWMQHKLKFHIDSEAAYKLEQKKRLLHQDQGDLEDGGLKIEIQKTQPLMAQFNVDELYDLIHGKQDQPDDKQ